MTYVISFIRSFVMIALCLNPMMMVASEYNRMYYHIPGSQPSFGNEWNLGVKKFISFPDQMTVIKVIIVGFLIFIVYKSKDHIVASLQNSINTDSYIDQYFPGYIAGPLKVAVIPLTKAAQFLFGCTKKYVYNNKIYMVGSGGSCIIGYVAGFPMIGGAVGGASFVAGLVQSLRQELAELRTENEALHLKTQMQMQTGFSGVEEKMDINNQELLKKVDELSGQISGITEQISQLNNDVSGKIDNVGDQVDRLSGELQKATEQMVKLHSNRDIKDAELFAKLEKTTNELAGAKESLVTLVTNSMEEASQKTKKEFEEINKAILRVDDKQNDQAVVLTKVQQNISLLLDNREIDEKRFTSLLDAIQSSNLSLEEVKTKSLNQAVVFNNIQTALDKMHKDRELFSESIHQSLVECTNMSDRISKLESKVDTNQVVVIELLKKNNEALLLRMELLEKNTAEEKAILLKKISDMEVGRKKVEEENKKKLDELVKFTRQYNNGHQQLEDSSKKINRNNKLNYDVLHELQIYSETSLKQQMQLANNF